MITDSAAILAQAQAATARAAELHALAADAEREAHVERQRRRTDRYQRFLDTYNPAALRTARTTSEETYIDMYLRSVLGLAQVEMMASRLRPSRLQTLAQAAMNEHGATPAAPVSQNQETHVADLYAEAAAFGIPPFAADAAQTLINGEIQAIHDEAAAAAAAVPGRDPTRWRVFATNRDGEDFTDYLGGKPLHFHDGVLHLDADDPTLAYFKRTPSAYEITGVFGETSEVDADDVAGH